MKESGWVATKIGLQAVLYVIKSIREVPDKARPESHMALCDITEKFDVPSQCRIPFCTDVPICTSSGKLFLIPQNLRSPYHFT